MPAVGLQEPGDAVEEGGLARAVGADDAVDAARGRPRRSTRISAWMAPNDLLSLSNLQHAAIHSVTVSVSETPNGCQRTL